MDAVINPFTVVGAGFLLCLPAWYVARRRKTWFELDYVSLLAPMPFWLMLTILQIGARSLSNLVVEVLMIAYFVPVALSFRVFVVDKFSRVPQRSSALTCLVCLALPLGLRLFMPALPE